jgi:LmbE family N-acetylglucosaminyl deacetylase
VTKIFTQGCRDTLRYDSVFISPHIDDVVYSCGGALLKALQSGRVLVISIFSDYGRKTPFRRREEEKVSLLYGYDYVFLDLPDLPQRDYLSFLPHRMHRICLNEVESDLLREIKHHLEELLRPIQFQSIYFPLGVGIHIDHEICFQASFAPAYSGKLFFYEDLPYALAPGCLERRIYSLLGKGVPIVGRQPISDWNAQRRRFIDHLFSRPSPLKRFSGVLRFIFGGYFSSLLKKNFDPFKAANISPISLKLAPHLVPIDDLFDLKLQGIWSYQSQTPLFFNSAEEARQLFRNYHSLLGESSSGLYERVWEATIPAFL